MVMVKLKLNGDGDGGREDCVSGIGGDGDDGS